MSIRTDKIRCKFRQQIRARQIQQFMRVQRAKALQACHQNPTSISTSTSTSKQKQKHNTFLTLDKQIKQTSNLPINMQTVNTLIKLMQQQQYVGQDNTYILIGNYVMYHGQAWRYFGVRLLGVSGVAKKLENYKRAILLTLSRTDQISGKLLEEYDATLAEILGGSELEDLAINLHFLNLILNLQNISQQKQSHYFPTLSITQFFKLITYLQFQLAQLKTQTKYNIMVIMHNIIIYHLLPQYQTQQQQSQQHLQLKLRQKQNDNIMQTIKKYLPEIIKILTLGIQQYVSFRSDFLNSLKYLTINFPSQFQQIFTTKQGQTLTLQLLYMYQKLPQERTKILTIFQSMVNQFQFIKLLRLLNFGLHVVLARTLAQGIQDVNVLQNCLKIILLVLNRLRQKQEREIIEKVLGAMEEENFQGVLEGLLAVRQDPVVERVLSQLVDDYYSDQVLE